MVDKIKEGNIVINLSNEEIPASTYLFLAKGLGFVPSRKVDTQDLKYDTSEFIRKLSWKAFFKANPELQSGDNQRTEHDNIRVSGFTYPSFNHPLLDVIKTKLFGWIANHNPSNPKPNLTPLEMRGKRWLLNKVKEMELFVTKADKGGAILIMNHTDVQEAIENELFDTSKFDKLSLNTEEQLSFVKNEVKSLSIYLEEKKLLTSRNKTLITGLTQNNRPKLAPEYQPESPYAYPLFKVHKLTELEIAEKKIPPSRLVHASKFGPLYRMEKWVSPYLTTISREFCKEEFILDTGDLIKNLNKLNEQGKIEQENVNLFTLDVEKLYPSIDPELAMKAINEILAKDTSTDKNIKTVIGHFIKLSFQNAYVSYKNETFKSKIGIPTGGSLSRQIADIFLHWILFIKANPKLTDIQTIRFWNRFIDDCIGVWRGTRRSFDKFVKNLNTETMKFGIKFPIGEIQFGKSVHFLDLTVYIDNNNKIQHKGYTKPTDAKRYLNPRSFHPRFVFDSVPFSQLLRTIRNNSKEETKLIEIENCIRDFSNSGYNPNELAKLKDKVINQISNNKPTEENNTLVFPVHFFDGVSEFKSVVTDLKDEIKELIGDTKVMFAMKKHSSLGNTLVRNKLLSIDTGNRSPKGQKCDGPGCLQCPLVNNSKKVVVNGTPLNIPQHLNCKTKNAIYMWTCLLCGNKETYFGRTVQKVHERTNSHRSCFTEEKWEKSALSMHANEVHQCNFSLKNFTISVVKKVSPQQIRREEYKFIDKYKTYSFGLNRYKS